MSKFTTSLNFPDVNVWMALVLENHIHREAAKSWWQATDTAIGFMRLTQMSLLRLLTTHAAMDGKPLAIDRAWQVYDRLFQDERVVFVPEPSEAERHFRRLASGRAASPKLWADAWLLAFAKAAQGVLVTFDGALGARGAHCILP
jgi:uncharacterized protein